MVRLRHKLALEAFALAFLLRHGFALADTAQIIVESNQCIENCANPANAITIANIGGSVSGFAQVRTELNEAGFVLFNATVTGPGLTTAVARQRVIRLNPDGSFSSLAHANQPITNLSGRSLYIGASNIMGYNYSWPALLDDGSVIMDAPVAVAGQTNVERALVCLDGSNAYSLARIGGQIPGEANGITFGLPTGSIGFAVNVAPVLYSSKGLCSATIRANAYSTSPALNVPGVWQVALDHDTSRVGRIGFQAPGLPAGVNFGVGVPPAGLPITQVNMSRVEYAGTAEGHALVHSYLQGTGVRRDPTIDAQPLNNQAFWYKTPAGEMILIARSGDPAPGISDAVFSSFAYRIFFPGSPGVSSQLDFQALDLNRAGKYAFKASVVDNAGNPVGNGIWSNRTGTLELVARSPSTITDQLTGQAWQLVSVGYAALNQPGIHLAEDGTIYYVGDGMRPGTDALSRKLLIEDRPTGEKRVLAWQGQSIVGVSGGVLNSGFASNFTVIDGEGVAFIAQVGTHLGLLVFRNNQLRMIASSSQPLLSLGETAYPTIHSSWNGPLPINARGQFLQKVGGGLGFGFALMNLDGDARWAINQSGHFPYASDVRLTTNQASSCTTWGINNNDEALFNCRSYLVRYRAEDGPNNTCSADFNSDNQLSVDDLFSFLAAWFAMLPSADFSGDSTITVQDIFDFLDAWFTGCD